jgi:carbamoylphosphate synthase large subunit
MRRSEEFQATVIACDTNSNALVAASVVAHGFQQLVSAKDADFARRVPKILGDLGVKFFYPIHDEEIRVASHEVSAFRGQGIIVCAPSAQAVELATDKLTLGGILSKVGIRYPETVSLSEERWFDGGVIVKPRRGVGSRGVTIFDEREQLDAFRHSPDVVCGEYVCQRPLAEPELTVDVFFDPERNFHRSICRERIEVRAGITTKARIFRDEAVADLGARLAACLGLCGSFCFQVRLDNDGQWAVIDVNPRIGGATATSVAIGLDFPTAHVAYFAGRDARPYFSDAEGEYHVCSSYREHVTSRPPT